MPEWTQVAVNSIIIDRLRRQRKAVRDASGAFIDSDGLLASISERGVINAIIVTEDLVLIAGERRLEASKELKLATIPVRLMSDLSPEERHIIELEENLKRTDLPWRDEVRAVADLHGLYKAKSPAWTIEDTKREIGYSQLNVALRVAQELDNPKLALANGVRAAFNILSRQDSRAAANALSSIIEAGEEIFQPPADPLPADPLPMEPPNDDPPQRQTSHGENVESTTPRKSIICADFHEWARDYSGPAFNFIHCDFPYGINLFAGVLSGRANNPTYEDSAKTYFELITTLCTNLHRLMSHSGHLFFWLSADISIQRATLEKFRQLAPQLEFRSKPLIWHKTDNVGIIANPKSDPRHVYECAITASLESREIVRSVNDCCGAPTDKSHHGSTKPEPVLKHFFRMFVDEHTRMLDPTCGSGAALRAAEALGAEYVLGLEKDKETALNAESALRSFRALRSISS